jgi:hypothetical protein
MGCRGSGEEFYALIDEGLALSLAAARYEVCFAHFPITVKDGEVDLGFACVGSRDLAKNLDGCESAVIFAATVGLEFDRLIAKYGRTSPSLALCIQAIGAERIEALCDVFCDELADTVAREGKKLRPRFSAGYGDLPLELQKDIFRTLSCQSKIGLTLNDALLMSPSKSVTAIVGIK